MPKELAIPVPGPGRNTSYQPEYAEQARKLCLLGHTDIEMADFFGVSEKTIYNWKHAHPAFLQATIDGKTVADAEVANSLYKRATGEEVQLEKVVKASDGSYEAVRYKSYIPGDANAAFKWLMNRRSKDWREKSELNHTGAIELTTKEQRDAAVAAAQRADG